MKHKSKKYIKSLIKNNPNIISGRKNFEQFELRVIKTISIVKKYFKLKQ